MGKEGVCIMHALPPETQAAIRVVRVMLGTTLAGRTRRSPRLQLARWMAALGIHILADHNMGTIILWKPWNPCTRLKIVRAFAACSRTQRDRRRMMAGQGEGAPTREGALGKTR